jgi:ankyrin repeat protein
VIHLENSNEWNLSPAKEGSSKKREEQRLKSKRGETSFEKLHDSKKKREDEIYTLLGDILSKERKKGDHIFL